MKAILTIAAALALATPAWAQDRAVETSGFNRSTDALVAAYGSWDASGRPCEGPEALAVARQLDALTAAYNRASDRAIWIESEGDGLAAASLGARDPALAEAMGARLGPNAFVVGVAAEEAGCEVLAEGAYMIVSRLALRGATMAQANRANRYLFRDRSAE